MPARSAAARIAADRFEKQAQRRAADQKPERKKYRRKQDKPARNQTDMPDAEPLKQRAFEAWVGSAVEQVDHQPDAAAGDHQDQGRDDRLDVEDRDQKAVPQAADEARAKGEQQNDEMGIAGVDTPGDHRAANGDDRADREIDSLRADDDRHPNRDKRRRHGPVENVDQIAEQAALDDANVEEPGRDQTVDGEDQRKRDDRPDRSMPRERAQPQGEGPFRLGARRDS